MNSARTSNNYGKEIEQMKETFEGNHKSNLSTGKHIDLEVQKQIFDSIQNDNEGQLRKVLNFFDFEDLDSLREVKNERKENILVYAAYANSTQCFIYLFNSQQQHFQDTKQSKEIFKQWVLQASNEGFTALHYATCNGNRRIIKLLCENLDADPQVRNSKGLNCLHMAAQKNQVWAIVYFLKSKGCDINSTDNLKRTPIHWACYSCSEEALDFLLNLKPFSKLINLEAKDELGFTPLHLAVKSVVMLKSTRIVRALLLKGASRNVKNAQGQKPLALIDKDLPKQIRNDLKGMLKPQRFMECCMVKPPVLPLSLNLRTVFLFTILLIYIYFNLFFVIYPNLPQWYYACSTSMIGLKLVLAYFFVFWKDPGYLSADDENGNGEKYSVEYLLENLSPSQICSSCQLIKAPRSKHCNICDRCVDRYDNHCVWVNNCVGVKTHNYYISFVWCVWLDLLLVICIAMDSMGEGASPHYWENPFGSWCVWCESANFYYANCIFDLFVCTVYFVPATLLFYIQVKNYCLGLTTYERFAKRQKDKRSKLFATRNTISNTQDADIIEPLNLSHNISQNDMNSKRDTQQTANGASNSDYSKNVTKKEKLTWKKCWHNCGDMCCNRVIKSQKELFEMYKKKQQNEYYSKNYDIIEEKQALAK